MTGSNYNNKITILCKYCGLFFNISRGELYGKLRYGILKCSNCKNTLYKISRACIGGGDIKEGYVLY